MRHLEGVEVPVKASNDEMFGIKQEDFEELTSSINLKVEIPDISLDDCEPFMKTEFVDVNVPYNLDDDLGFDLADVESEIWKFSQNGKKSGRKNKRKSHAPQKNTKKKEISVRDDKDDAASLENPTEKDVFNSNSELPQSDQVLKDFDEDNIFRGYADDKGDESLEMIDNVKEEFRSHWGVKCNMCEKVFPYRAEFDEHYTSTYNITPVYTCAFCNKTIEKYSTFRSHCYRHITEGRHKCTKCTKAFCLQSLLQVHIISKHGKVKPFSCEECGKNFMTQAGLKMHLRKHQSEIKEDYPCVVCGKVLHTRGGLTSHMNVHRLGRRFMCDVCGKTFTQKVNMQQHAKQHTGDKPHRCDKCGKTFAEKSHLARHYSFHSDQRPFKCEVCNKMYKTERCLKVHSMVHAEERPFICTYCNKGFLSSTKLKQHYNVHTGERPYVCKYCERTFTNYPNWLKHIRRRHKVDHKTGKNLETPETNTIKKSDEQLPIITQNNRVENISTQIENVNDPQSCCLPQDLNSVVVPVDAQTELTSDLVLSKTEELILQQTFMQYPIIEDKYMFNPGIDFSNINNVNNTIILPFFPNVTQPVNTTTGNVAVMVNDIAPHFLEALNQNQLPPQTQ
nr:zinc finger protein 480-like [Onthophagus taurus]XP_022902565.1 zinc finger protein 480-like [Onthophagus taurus]XP_022902566.1 zinc finger protein 480-like [Onthophagus taurus]